MNSTTQALERCRDGFIAERATGQPCLDDWREETLRMIEAALSQRTDPWRQAVDEALIAHALDCTGPGDDPKEKVKELIEWAVTIATDPRVSEPRGMRETVADMREALHHCVDAMEMKQRVTMWEQDGDRAKFSNALYIARAALAADKKGETK